MSGIIGQSPNMNSGVVGRNDALIGHYYLSGSFGAPTTDAVYAMGKTEGIDAANYWTAATYELIVDTGAMTLPATTGGEGGIWSFPRTGWWYVGMNFSAYATTSYPFWTEIHIKATDDSSTFNNQSMSNVSTASDNQYYRGHGHCETILKVENLSLDKVYFTWLNPRYNGSAQTNVSVHGGTGNATTCMFQWLANL
jgi:hypothetical protein